MTQDNKPTGQPIHSLPMPPYDYRYKNPRAFFFGTDIPIPNPDEVEQARMVEERLPEGSAIIVIIALALTFWVAAGVIFVMSLAS